MKIDITLAITLGNTKPLGVNVQIDGSSMEDLSIDEIRTVLDAYIRGMSTELLKQLGRVKPETVEEE
jgi:hypothetical protein